MQCLLSCLSPDKICANKILIPASLVIVILETGPSRWRLNLQLIIETCRAQSELSIPHWSPTVLWTMFFFMSLSFFLLTLFSNLWIATGHKSMWIRHLAYFKILATLPDNTHTVYFPWAVIHTRFILAGLMTKSGFISSIIVSGAGDPQQWWSIKHLELFMVLLLLYVELMYVRMCDVN